MRISRKQAVFGSVTLLLVWFGARAIASPSEVTVVASVPLQTEVADLRNQVQQLQAIVANQVGFTKNANGDLSLAGTGHVTITATTLDSQVLAGEHPRGRLEPDLQGPERDGDRQRHRADLRSNRRDDQGKQGVRVLLSPLGPPRCRRRHQLGVRSQFAVELVTLIAS